MNINYIEPLSRGISRTRKALFNPLKVKKWFVVGFTAFLAGLGDGGFGGWPGFRRRSKFNVEDVLYFPQKAWQWIISHPGIFFLAIVLVFLLLIIGILIAWLSARGKFMFLDNVVCNQSRVVAPWYEYRKEGNSFFLFNLLLGLIQLPIAIVYLFFCFLNLQSIYRSAGHSSALIFPAILAGLGLLAGFIIGLFIFILLRSFVVPIMYKNRITTWSAIQKFFPVFLSNFFHFIGYGLFLVCLYLLIALGIGIAGCITCCIGFLFLLIPYINAVVLLPISYAFRSFSVEFLGQFGPEFQVFPRPEAIPPPPETTMV